MDIQRPTHLRTRPTGRGRITVLVCLTALAVVAAACASDADVVATTAATSPTTTNVVTLAPTTKPSTTTTTTTTTAPTTTTTTLPPTTVTLPPTTTTEPIVTEGGIILIANASGVSGAAAKLGATLREIGFVVTDPINAAGNDKDLQTSLLYAVDTASPVARSVAKLMGDLAVLPMPTPVPVQGADRGEADIVVMLGHDLAGKRLPGI